ncbi:MAG: YjbE family putative metal transport protein [Pseudomonadota bacterium]
MQHWVSPADLSALLQVIFINVVLSGDNAVVIGMAAAGLEPRLRHKAITFGIVVATVLRIGFALVAVELLAVVGVMLLGGLLLGYVAWKMFRELRQAHLEADAAHPDTPRVEFPRKSLRAAMWQIMVADISMSLDNVLAVAGIAASNPTMLVVGLVISIILMAVASSVIATLLARYRWISWIGLALIVYVAVVMIYDGAKAVALHLGWLAA